jgi:hypothetical protein
MMPDGSSVLQDALEEEEEEEEERSKVSGTR